MVSFGWGATGVRSSQALVNFAGEKPSAEEQHGEPL
jgi:hypothetical protein